MRTSGVINASELLERFNERESFIRVKERESFMRFYGGVKYNWSPWCIVTTDHRYYMQITTIDHADNNYNSGTHREIYSKAKFNHWKYIFTGELSPVSLPSNNDIFNGE